MADKPKIDPNSAASGYICTDPYTQTIQEGKIDTEAQDYIAPPDGKP